MSRYVCYYSSRKVIYRELAEKWVKWAANAELSDIELAGISKFFSTVARRFGLIKEFKNLGVI